MPNAQDHAFAQLARQRGLLGPDQLRQVEALRTTLPHDEPLAQLTLKGKVLPPAAVAGILRDLTRGVFACERCPERVPYDALGRLERLACPRCGAGLQHRADPSDGAVIQSHDSGRFPAARPTTHGGTGAVPAAQGQGTGAYPSARGTGVHKVANPATGAYPTARSTGAFGPGGQRLRPSDGASLQPPAAPPPTTAAPAVPPPAVPAVWDAAATIVDRARRSTGARAVTSLGATSAGGAGAGTTGAHAAVPPPVQPALLPGEETVRDPPTAPLKPPPGMPQVTVDSTRVERIEPIPIPGTNESVRSIGPYHLISEIGRGQGGVIYLARKQGLERRYAVKVLLGDDLADEESVKRFQLEAAVASKLDDPGIVGVFDTGRVAGKWYYAMDYVPGETLERRLERGPLGPPEASRLVSQLARTVHKAHAQGVVHRDLKPANIIIEESTGRPKITDFGVARDRTLLRSVTVSGELLGTPAYMAPEQIKGERSIDHRVDIYALGVILFEAVAGRRPFEAKTTILLAEKVVHDEAPLLSAVFPAAPQALVEVCSRALARDRGGRYDSARDLADDLERAMRSPRARGRGGAGGGGRWTTVVAAVATALATVAVGTAIILGDHPPGPPPVDPAAEAARLAAERSARLTVASQALDAASTRLDQAQRAEPAELQAVLESVEAAVTVVAEDEALSTRAASLHRRAKVELGLAQARDLSRQRAPTDEVLAALRAATEAAGTERGLSARARLARAELLRRRGRPKDALAEAEGLSSAEGAVGFMARAIAGAVLLDTQGARGRDSLSSLAQDDPKGPAGLVAQSFMASIEGRNDDAVALAQRAREADPTFALAHLRAARALLVLRRSADATREAVEAALAIAPDDVGALVTRAELDLASGATREKVLPDLDLAARLSAPEVDPTVLFERARTLLGLERYAQALADLDALVRREPENFAATFLRGVAHEATSPGSAKAVEDWRRARALDEGALERAIETLPDRPMRRRVREALGIADVSAPTVRVGQVGPEAERLLQARAARAPAAAREPLQVALGRAARGDPWRQLELHYDRAERAAPGDPVVALERARVTVGRDAYAAATAAIAKARTAGAPALELDRLAGELLLRQDHRTEADKALRDLARRDPDGVEGRCALAEAELLRGRNEQALAATDAALALDREHTGALTAKALVLVELGQDRKGFELIARVLERQGALDARPLLGRYVATTKAVLGEASQRGGLDQSDLSTVGAELDAYMRTSDSAAGAIIAAGMALYVQEKWVRDFGKRMLASARQREAERPDLLLVLGRYAVVDARDPKRALELWRRARELEPMFVISDQARAEYERSFGPSSEVDALTERR